MFSQLLSIFFTVITPVFALVVIGYWAAPRLDLQARTLSRYAYFILVPCFVFDVLSRAEIDLNLATQMIIYIVLVEIGVAVLGFTVAKLLRRSGPMVGAYILIATFGNVGNFGLPIIQFHLGPGAIDAATVYFLAILTVAFIICVGAAAFYTGRGAESMAAVFKTPALLALPPALLVNWFDWPVPLTIVRITQLLGAAMVPTMLVTLGVQLAEMERVRLSADVWIASGVRLIGGPLLAIVSAGFFVLGPIETGAGIFQAGMPAAVLTSIIALENDLVPDFVTTAVLVSTLLSVVTLTVLLAVV